MAIEIKVPSPGESISEVEIAEWFFQTGDQVEKDQEIGEVESEKATLPLIAEESGEITILKEVGATVAVGDVVCTIDPSAAGKSKSSESEPAETELESEQKPAEAKAEKKESETIEASKKVKDAKPEEAVQISSRKDEENSTAHEEVKITPVARKMMEEYQLDVVDIIEGLKKITSREVQAVKNGLPSLGSGNLQKSDASREVQRSKMINLRRKLGQRLVSVRNETAMLTTFNEADMSRVIELRKKYQKEFIEKHDVKLGFMSFFTKAVTMALQDFPNVNSQIEGEEILTPEYCDIGIAVQTDKGLMVPVLRNTEAKSLADIEREILELAGRARKNRLSIEEMSGGTFTITNGGIYGSMLSTPILNPPQSAILGMHNIQERPVAINGSIEIKPMMYLALSYDHRMIDGRDSVSFLVRVKELIEEPEKMLFGRNDPEKTLLQI